MANNEFPNIDPFREQRVRSDGTSIGSKVAIWTAVITVVGGVLTSLIYGVFGHLNGSDKSNSTLIRSVGGVSAGRDININSADATRAAEAAEAALRYQREKDARDREEGERLAKAYVEEARRKILNGGYTLDAKGFASAVAEDYTYYSEFKKLNIETTEPAVRAVLKQVNQNKRVTLIGILKIDKSYPFANALYNEVSAFPEQLINEVYSPDSSKWKPVSAATKARLCDPAQYKYWIDKSILAEACKAQNTDFNSKYVSFAKGGI